MAISRSKGNMYDWCSHMHTHLRGKCSHGCSYCYVQAMERIYNGGHYAGDLRLSEKDLDCSYDTPKIRREALESGFHMPVHFIEHCNDLFASDVPDAWISRILAHCCLYQECGFIFQSKNPCDMVTFLPQMPDNRIIGTTVESDVVYAGQYECLASMPPSPQQRLNDIGVEHRGSNQRCFVTIEPILRMQDPVSFARLIADCRPDFVNIGADSKGTGLPEPSREQVLELIDALKANGVTIRKKINLERLLK